MLNGQSNGVAYAVAADLFSKRFSHLFVAHIRNVGWAMSDPAKTALVADLAEEDQRGRVFGIYELVTGIGRCLAVLAKN